MNVTEAAAFMRDLHRPLAPTMPCTRPRTCLPGAEHAPLLVYHPQGGLSNCLFGLSSAALLATAMCRRFAIAWGKKVNPQAGAPFSDLFQRPEGVAFLNESEGHDLVAAIGGEQKHTSGPCVLQLNTHWNKSRTLSSLFNGDELVSRCQVVHVRSNMYYAPLLERDPRVTLAGRWMRTRGLSCTGGSTRHEGEPYFAAVSKHLFAPHAAISARADVTSIRKPDEAVIGVHVRSTLLLALHKDRRTAACGKSLECEHILQTYGFLDCVAKVRNASHHAGFQSSRVYVAADNAMVRTEALKAWGKDDLLPVPPYLYAGREARGKMITLRGTLATAGAVDEMLLLARADAIVVWDLLDSTYSATAASWAAHRAGGQRIDADAARKRAWVGVYVASRGCKRIPDAEVDPPTHKTVNGEAA